MPIQDHATVSKTSLALLRPLLAALGATDTATATVRALAGLPVPCIQVPTLSTVLCATPIQSPRMFRLRMVAAACERELDIILVRHGLLPEIVDEVAIDAVLHRESPLEILSGLVAYLGEDGRYWLVPPAGRLGDSIRVDAFGLTITARPPYRTLDERGDGVSRAARQSVLALRRTRRS